MAGTLARPAQNGPHALVGKEKPGAIQLAAPLDFGQSWRVNFVRARSTSPASIRPGYALPKLSPILIPRTTSCGRPTYPRTIPPMSTGTVKWFNGQKGYGFIKPDDGGADVFVHISAVERAGLRTLNEGDKITYDLERARRSGKMAASNLQV